MAIKKNKKDRFGSAFDRVLATSKDNIETTDVQTSKRPDVQTPKVVEETIVPIIIENNTTINKKKTRSKLSLKDKGYEKVTLYIAPEIKKQLKVKSMELDLEMSEIVNSLIERYINKIK